jgi:hypothetical protein
MRRNLSRNRVGRQVERAAHRASTGVQDVRVDRRRFDALVAEQFLHGADVGSRFEQVRGERMAQGVSWPACRCQSAAPPRRRPATRRSRAGASAPVGSCARPGTARTPGTRTASTTRDWPRVPFTEVRSARGAAPNPRARSRRCSACRSRAAARANRKPTARCRVVPNGAARRQAGQRWAEHQRTATPIRCSTSEPVA